MTLANKAIDEYVAEEVAKLRKNNACMNFSRDAKKRQWIIEKDALNRAVMYLDENTIVSRDAINEWYNLVLIEMKRQIWGFDEEEK